MPTFQNENYVTQAEVTRSESNPDEWRVVFTVHTPTGNRKFIGVGRSVKEARAAAWVTITEIFGDGVNVKTE